MQCMGSAELAVLLYLHSFRMGLLILSGVVITVLALCAGKSYSGPHVFAAAPFIIHTRPLPSGLRTDNDTNIPGTPPACILQTTKKGLPPKLNYYSIGFRPRQAIFIMI